MPLQDPTGIYNRVHIAANSAADYFATYVCLRGSYTHETVHLQGLAAGAVPAQRQL